MARPPLRVKLNDATIGRLEPHRDGLRFTYNEEALRQLPGGAPLLSCSLPLDARPQRAQAYFEGLLPEGQHRAALAARADVAASDTYGLLSRYGRDIAGAVVIEGPDGDRPRDPAVLPLTEAELNDELASLPERPLGVHDDSELSLAGLQDKLLVVQLDTGGWGRPTGGSPSTHIIKRDPPQFPGIVAAEAQCLAIARSVGLTSIHTRIKTVDDIDYLIVERFDRNRTGDTVARVHQEDACQALAVGPGAKYEVRQGGGGPEFSQIAGLLDRYAADPLAQLSRLAAIATFTALIGNADGHGKNVSFLHPTPGVIELAPLYDQVPTRMWPKLRPEAAMTIGGAVNLDTVTPERIGAEAKLWSYNPGTASDAAITMAEAVLAATLDGTIDPEGDVARFVRKRTERFLAR